MSNVAGPQPLDLVSGEGVAFELRRAGVGSRLIAGLLDLLVQFIAILVLFWGESKLAVGSSFAAVSAVVVINLLLVLLGYPLVMEWLNRGRTLGKMALGLRAVRDDGGPLTFRQALVRALSGLLLEKPGLIFPLTTCVGVLSIMLTNSSKRVGDMLAGTFVLNERGGPTKALNPTVYTVPYPLQGWAATADLSGLSDQLALSLRQYLARAAQLTPQARFQLGEQLKAQLLAVIAPPPPWDVFGPQLMETVLGERRRRAEVAAVPAWAGAAGPQVQPYPYPAAAPYPADAPYPAAVTYPGANTYPAAASYPAANPYPAAAPVPVPAAPPSAGPPSAPPSPVEHPAERPGGFVVPG